MQGAGIGAAGPARRARRNDRCIGVPEGVAFGGGGRSVEVRHLLRAAPAPAPRVAALGRPPTCAPARTDGTAVQGCGHAGGQPVAVRGPPRRGRDSGPPMSVRSSLAASLVRCGPGPPVLAASRGSLVHGRAPPQSPASSNESQCRPGPHPSRHASPSAQPGPPPAAPAPSPRPRPSAARRRPRRQLGLARRAIAARQHERDSGMCAAADGEWA